MKSCARAIVLFLGGSCTLALTAPVDAQSSSANFGELQEIVVTAQKRDESAQTVPQSLVALSGDVLERGAISGLTDLAAYVPGLMIEKNAGIAGDQLVLRGITSGNDVNATVAMYVNDIPYGSGTSYSGSGYFGLDVDSFDLQRVEVLRGPQGTLYGANAFGGVVKYVLTPPSLTGFIGRAQVDGSGTANGGGNYAVRAALNIPLGSDVWAMRVTGVRDHDGGYINNTGPNGIVDKDWDPTDTTVGRLSILGTPTDKLTVRAMALTQDINQQGSSRVDIDPVTLQPTSGRLDEARQLKESYSQTFRLYSVGADYDLDFATLTGAAGYQTIRSYTFQDVALFTDLLGPISAAQGFPIDRTAFPQEYRTGKTTVELRLASPETHHFDWLTGLYYTHENNLNNGPLLGFLKGVYVPFNFLTFTEPTTYKEYTAYADGTYYFTPRVDAQIGVRFAHDEQQVSQISSGLLAGPTLAAPKVDNNVETYLATFRFHLDDRNMLYARAASGYRPGGPNLAITDPVTGKLIGVTDFKPDKLWNYEVGAKLRPSNWLLIDASVFYMDWTDIQLQGVSNGFGIYANGGKADSKGVETSWVVHPIQAWTLSGSLAYTAAKLDDPVPDLDARAGQRLPNVPHFSSAVATEYTFSLLERQGRIGAAWNFTGSRNEGYAGSAKLAYVPLHSFATVDLHAGMDIGRFDLNLYAKNIFDKWALVSVDTADTLYRAAVLRPRTVGLMITMNF
jgi:iron complex outermembrane receptor protein